MCHSGFSAGPFYIHKNILSCEDQKQKLAFQIGVYYTVNTVTADFFYQTMSKINKTKDRLILELDNQVNLVDMTYDRMKKQKEKYTELSENIITDQQIYLSSPYQNF